MLHVMQLLLYNWYLLHRVLIRGVLRRAIYIRLLRTKVQNLMGKDIDKQGFSARQ